MAQNIKILVGCPAGSSKIMLKSDKGALANFLGLKFCITLNVWVPEQLLAFSVPETSF